MTRRSALSDAQLAITWHSARLLLERPSEAVLGQLESVHRTSHRLPDEVGGPLRSTLVHLERAPLAELEAEYVETFVDTPDPRRQLDLHAVLEEVTTTDRSHGRALLTQHRTELELLQASLQQGESGWAGAVAAVAATLPTPEEGAHVAAPRHLGRSPA